MSFTRVLGRASRATLTHYRSNFLSSPPLHHHNHFHSLFNASTKASPLHNGIRSAFGFPHHGMSFASPLQEQGSADTEASSRSQETDSEGDMDSLSKEDLGKLVIEKKEILEKKQKEFDGWKEKMLRRYAETENVMDRTRRDAENSKKFAIQSFAKNLLDVADNLDRASSVTKGNLNKIEASEDTVGAMPLLKTLLEGVEITKQQLTEVFRKAGIEKYDPIDEQFDPNRHNALFQVPDNSKHPGTVAVVMKAGYTLHDRIIRAAEVGVTVAVQNNEADS